MIRGLLALALALAAPALASLTCYSGTQVIYSGCSTANTNTINSTDADAYATSMGLAAGSYDTCMSYTYSGSAGRSCTYTQVVSTFTSSALLTAMGCDYYETSVETQTAAAGMTVTDGTWTCTTCTTDNCNQDALLNPTPEPTSNPTTSPKPTPAPTTAAFTPGGVSAAPRASAVGVLTLGAMALVPWFL